MTEQELQEKKAKHDLLKELVKMENDKISYRKLKTRRAIEHYKEEARLREMIEIDFE